jgi:pyruvate dehydrogenase E2 component (dihydrolipoamide acetyltransferase)
MATSVVMPALEMAQETGKVVSWVKKEGETLSKGEVLLEVETDKAVVEIEAPADGILAGVKAKEGDVVPVGQTIAWIVAPGEAVPADAPEQMPAARKMSEAAAPSRPIQQSAAAAAPVDAGKVQISPKARRLAKEKGVDISTIRGTGPDGIITTEDVMAAAEAPAAAPAAAAASTLSAIARLMADRTTESWTHVPHFFLVRDLDVSALQSLREQKKPATVTDLLISITARVLEKHPKMNATWTGSSIKHNPDINISVAMAVKDGVVGAVVPNANKAKLADITTQRKDLAERARGGRLRPQDVANGTFTITNLGMYNVDAFNAIIAPPQAAILAVGRITDRVVPVDGKPGIRPMMTLTLSGDHRVVDGAQAAMFLNDLAEAILAPANWIS